jgi:uncharacterized protein YbjT (DUF2867 family)
MKVMIFGATGESGRLTTEKALAAGHDVTIYVRNPAKVTASHTRLSVRKGELADKTAIAEAMAGQEAVISLLGPAGKAEGLVYSTAMRTIVDAMRSTGVRRLIATATPSAADPNDRFSLPFWLAVRMIKLMAGTAYEDLSSLGRVVRASGLDWTLVRLPWLTSKPVERPAVAGYVGDRPIKLFFLSRDRLADFLVGQLTDTRWVGKAPAISNG